MVGGGGRSAHRRSLRAARRFRLVGGMRVAVVGAGFSGIGMGAALGAAGHDYTIFERAEDLGGVWHHNTYPGAACDVPSYVYSYSWAQRRDWSRPCSPQPEIQDYLRAVATERRVIDRIRFGAEGIEARWDPATLTWALPIGGAPARTHRPDALVLGCGQLSRPAWPEIPGAERFAGRSFHSAQWDHGHEPTGERVAAVAAVAGRLDVYQRSAPWLLPRRNRAYPETVRALLRLVPGVQRLRRYGMCGVMEWITLGLTRSRASASLVRAWSAAFMWTQLRGDRSLRRRVWPDHPFGCKRILFSSDYLPTLRRANVRLIADAVAQITPTGLVTTAGD